MATLTAPTLARPPPASHPSPHTEHIEREDTQMTHTILHTNKRKTQNGHTDIDAEPVDVCIDSAYKRELTTLRQHLERLGRHTPTLPPFQNAHNKTTTGNITAELSLSW